MLNEGFPRLAVRLRSALPDANISLVGRHGLKVHFPTFNDWVVEVAAKPCQEQFHFVESKIILNYECLKKIPQEEFYRLLSAENLGLCGASVVIESERGPRCLAIRSAFVAQKGRTRDEAENLLIDVLSLARFAKLFDDRISRSQVGDRFSYDIYYTLYLARSIGRNRFVNYARSVFEGSTERVFAQLTSMFRDEYNFSVNALKPTLVSVAPPNASTSIMVRIPEEVPMIACTSTLKSTGLSPDLCFALVARLNPLIKIGHFEVNPDGALISFATWKHLTNDLRFYSLDHLVAEIYEAERLLLSELANIAARESHQRSAEKSSDQASTVDPYSRNVA